MSNSVVAATLADTKWILGVRKGWCYGCGAGKLPWAGKPEPAEVYEAHCKTPEEYVLEFYLDCGPMTICYACLKRAVAVFEHVAVVTVENGGGGDVAVDDALPGVPK